MSLTCIHIPVVNGRAFASGSTDVPLCGSVDDTNISKWVATFDPDVEQFLHFVVPVFSDYSSGGTLRIRWRGNATSGAVVWKVYYGLFSTFGGVIGSAATTSTTTTTVAGTANVLNETTMTFSGLAAGNLLAFTISRDATSGSDTCTVAADLLDVQFEYACDATVAKEYLFVGAKSMNIASGATRTTIVTLASNANVIDAFTIVDTNTVDFKFNVPSNFNSALKWSYWTYHTNSFQTSTNRLDMGAASVGASDNPSLTTGTNLTKTNNSAAAIGQATATATDVQPTAGQEVNCRFACVTAAGGGEKLVGVTFEYAATTKNPGTVRMDPNSGNFGSTGGMTQVAISDSNSTKLVARAASGGVDNQVDFLCHNPSVWASGGTLRVRWRTPASTGNGYFRVDWASPANGTSPDPTLTAGTATAYATGGANIINEFTIDISAGIVASDTLLIRLTRLGSNVLDTLSNTVDFLEVVFEANVS